MPWLMSCGIAAANVTAACSGKQLADTYQRSDTMLIIV